MTAANPDRWAAPNYASFTGSDATPLQQTFQSLSAYLEKINNSVTVASGTGVTSLTGTTNQVTVSGATGAITISFPTNLVLAGNVSGAAAAGVSLSLGTWSATATWGAIQGGNGYLLMTHSGSDRSIYLRTDHNSNVNIGGAGNNVLVVGPSSVAVNGPLTISTYIAAGGSGLSEGISTPNWFRSTGATGWFNQTYGGGITMEDATWVRISHGKNFFSPGEIRSGNSFSNNATRLRGSYGSININSNGKTNDWQGFEFQAPETQTFMVQNDNYSGMYRANTTWNWLWNYNTLAVGSDIRYKRKIEPLNIGLNFIKELEPISYQKLTESCDDDPEECEAGYYYGFSAQNVRAALDACGETRNVKIHDIGGPNMGLVACTEHAVYDRQYLGVTEFMGPVVLAIKELEERLSLLEGTV